MNQRYLMMKGFEEAEQADKELVEKQKEDSLRLEAESQTEKAPEQFGVRDNIKEAGNAVVGGVVDIYNSVGSLPKLFDPKFYQAENPDEPYKFDAPWLIKSKPITKTKWGGFIRGGIELAGGMVGTGKVLWGVKGLSKFATAAKATRWGRVGLGAIQGGTYDVISNQSQEQNLARTLIDIKPNWAPALDPLATNESMSPALRSVYNVGEGLGIGAFFDVAIEGAGWGIKSYSIKSKKAAKKTAVTPNPVQEAVDKSADIDYGQKTIDVETGAKQQYEVDLPTTSATQKNPRLKDLKVFEQRREKTVLEMNTVMADKKLGVQQQFDAIDKLNEVIHNYDTEIDAIKGWKPTGNLDLTKVELPKSLKGAKPTYNYGKTPINLEFDNDIARALYIVGSGKPSKRRTAYVEWLQSKGIQNPESAAMSIRANIKSQAKQGVTDQRISIPKNLQTKAVVSRKSWDQLNKKQKQELMHKYAEEKGIDWGDYRDMSLRKAAQGKANKDLAVEQLEFDLANGSPRENPAYYKGGDVSDNQALSGSNNPVEAVRDMNLIRSEPSQKYGSPRQVVTEANIERMSYATPGATQEQIDSLGKVYKKTPSFEPMKGRATEETQKQALHELSSFLSESGNSHLFQVPEENLTKYIRSIAADKPYKDFGLPLLNSEQLHATDAILGQLLKESRDLAKGKLSAPELDLSSPGSLTDRILARYESIAILRKETSIARARGLSSMGKEINLDQKTLIENANKAAKNEVQTFKQLLRSDIDDDLLEQFMHFTATSNGNMQTWKDLDAFFKRKLRGYRGADGYERNAILNELATMGVNSMLSGPKTPARALIGTGIQTIARPAATILGALGQGNDRVLKGAWASVGGMIEARNDAWRKAVADFQSYNMEENGWRGFTKSKADDEWDTMAKWIESQGTAGDKAQLQLATSLRHINKMPFFNYGPRVMKSMDVFFSQIIARGRVRQIAFDDVYARAAESGKVLSDTDMEDLVKQAEVEFEGRVWTADGEISDEMAKFAADEAKLTQQLTGFAKDLDKVFEKQPFLRPFFLFARTGVNALKMTSKYTPVLNSFITEHVDIMTKQFDDPALLRYGIKTQQDLDIAKATMRGRQAIGYGVTSSAALLALNGQITGNGPPDRGLRNSWIQQGWQPRSIKIGDAYISYEALEPFNMFFSFIADIVDAQKVMGDEWTASEFSKAAYIMSANVTNKSFLAGLLQLQDLLTSQGQDASRVAANFVNNQIPLSGMRNEIGKLLSPGMRELETGFLQSVGNRNLWADVVSGGSLLPYRYDVLNGKKLRDYDPLTRLVNAVLPFSINVGTNETRETLFRSGLNLKQTFNTGPNGEQLENHPDLKSKYQFYMGQQNIEDQLTKLFESKQIRGSIFKMEQDRERGDQYDPEDTLHGPIISELFRTAKRNAWSQLVNDPELGGKAQRLDYLHDMRMLEDTTRKMGDRKGVKNIRDEIKRLESMTYK